MKFQDADAALMNHALPSIRLANFNGWCARDRAHILRSDAFRFLTACLLCCCSGFSFVLAILNKIGVRHKCTFQICDASIGLRDHWHRVTQVESFA